MSGLPKGDALATRAAAMAFGLLLGVGCGTSSLDALGPSHSTTSDSGEETDTLPALETGHDPASTGTTDGGADSEGTEAGACLPGCRMTVPVDWSYVGSPEPARAEPGTHRVPAMMREVDGTLTIAEQRRDWATLHRLDRRGELEWNRPLPLPCDLCEIGDIGLHPSGDLLLSGAGHLIDGEFALLAGRYRPGSLQEVWVTSLPLEPIAGVQVRGGDIVAISDVFVVQLYIAAQVDFSLQQATGLVVYGADGILVENTTLAVDEATSIRPPVRARVTPTGELGIAITRGSSNNPFVIIDRMEAPLWAPVAPIFVPERLDDMIIDVRDHSLELRHTFDGDKIHMLLSDRAGLDPIPRWVATLAFPSTTDSRAALAVGPEGDLYMAIRTTQYSSPLPDPPPEPLPDPLVGLSIARFSSEGELRWHTTVLTNIEPSSEPLALAVDDTDGLVVATIVDHRLHVERREQRCLCE